MLREVVHYTGLINRYTQNNIVLRYAQLIHLKVLSYSEVSELSFVCDNYYYAVIRKVGKYILIY